MYSAQCSCLTSTLNAWKRFEHYSCIHNAQTSHLQSINYCTTKASTHHSLLTISVSICIDTHLLVLGAHLVHEHGDVVIVPHPRVAGEVLQHHHGLVQARDCLHHPASPRKQQTEKSTNVKVDEDRRCSIWFNKNKWGQSITVTLTNIRKPFNKKYFRFQYWAVVKWLHIYTMGSKDLRKQVKLIFTFFYRNNMIINWNENYVLWHVLHKTSDFGKISQNVLRFLDLTVNVQTYNKYRWKMFWPNQI